ncbi:MAG: hypothetical protein JWO31_4265 [Phycisphaerales bacterium]|nr:hypothetical protein [Phycisphaerales bacterium]
MAPADVEVWVARVGAGAVVLTAADLTSGLLDLRTWGVVGFEPDACDGLVRNVLLWAMDGHPDGPAADAAATTGPADPAPATRPGD